MQIVSQETFLKAESEGQLFLDHQFAMIQCINDWRIKFFQAFGLNMDNYIPRLQLDIQVIKQALVNPENSSKVNFTLGQIGVMDILRMNFKSCQKRLKSFLLENKDNLSFNLVSDLMKNTQILREYFSYNNSFESLVQKPYTEQQQFQENNIEQHSSEEDIHLDFNSEEDIQINNNISTICASQEEDNFKNIFDSNNNEIQLDFDENFSNNSSNRNSQEIYDNFFQEEYSNQQSQYISNNNNNINNTYPQHFILLE